MGRFGNVLTQVCLGSIQRGHTGGAARERLGGAQAKSAGEPDQISKQATKLGLGWFRKVENIYLSGDQVRRIYDETKHAPP